MWLMLKVKSLKKTVALVMEKGDLSNGEEAYLYTAI